MKIKFQLTYVCLMILINNAAAITEKYMDQMCGETLDLDLYETVRLKLTAQAVYKPNMLCHLTIKTNSFYQIMFYFKSFALESMCYNDWLELHDGKYSASAFISGMTPHQCGTYKRTTVRNTSGKYLHLRFESDGTIQNSGFDMVLTKYHNGICYTDEYACSNGHCIANNISCNGFNPCGDYSDCGNNVISGSSSRVFNVGGIIGGVISAVTALVIIVIVAVVVVKRQNRRPCAGRQLQAPVHMRTTATAPPAPQQYTSQLPQQYASQVPQQYASPVPQHYEPPPPYSTCSMQQKPQPPSQEQPTRY